MTNYRPGSEGAAEQKDKKKYKIFMAVLTVIGIILLWTVPLLKYEASQTGGGYKFFSWLFFAVAFAALYFEEWITDKATSETAYGFIWFISWGIAFFLRICGGV